MCSICGSMADSERVDADPDPTFHIDADSDPNFTQFVKEVPVPPRYLLKRKTKLLKFYSFHFLLKIKN